MSKEATLVSLDDLLKAMQLQNEHMATQLADERHHVIQAAVKAALQAVQIKRDEDDDGGNDMYGDDDDTNEQQGTNTATRGDDRGGGAQRPWA